MVRSRHKSRRSKRSGRRKRDGKKWIQKAIKDKGALKEWAQRNKRKIAAATHSSVFTKNGKELNTNTLRKLRHTRMWNRLSTKTKKRVDLAITLEELRKGK